MVTNTSQAARHIAVNLSGIRKLKGLSQAKLATLAGVTRASVALLESGSANPSLEILLKICLFLRISIEELIASPRAECRLIRAAQVPVDRRSKNGVSLRKLLPDKIPATEMDELHLDIGATLTGSPHIQGTREYFTCVRGEVQIGVLGQVYKLEKGDVLSFPGDKPHSYRNVGRTVAQGISVVLFAAEFTSSP